MIITSPMSDDGSFGNDDCNGGSSDDGYFSDDYDGTECFDFINKDYGC